MAQRKNGRGHRNHRAAAGSSGSTSTTVPRALHSVIPVPETLPATTLEPSIWGRRRVLLLNSTYEPLTALPMRRAVVMLM
ncbi:endonuclease, partial [Mycobacterium sp. ITM-2017-0098]